MRPGFEEMNKEEMTLMVEHNNQSVGAMIISVGGTPEPLVKTIEHHRPEFVCFLASQGTLDKTVQVKQSLGDLAKGIRFETELVDNENDLLECHEKAIMAVERTSAKGYAKERVLVDYTGATKNMSVSLALAAIEQGFGFSYVGGDKRTKNGVGTVESGHEMIYTHVNPWDFMALKEKRQASQFFNSCQFKACRDLLADLAGNASARRSMYRKLSCAVDAFHNWDLFRHAEALDSFKKARLEDLRDERDRGVAAFAADCLQLKPVLENLINCSNRGKRPCEELALDLFSNAERRFAEGKVDDAVLRLYRLVEMLAQERLLRFYEIDTSDVKADKIPASIRDEFLEKYRNGRTQKIELPQSPSYKLLKELGDQLGKDFETHQSRFMKVQSARNSSYLAHGFMSSKDTVYEDLRAFVMELGGIKQAIRYPEMRLR